MGERSRIMKRRRQSRLYASIAVAGLIVGGALLAGINILGKSDEPVGGPLPPTRIW
jgi:hypothetical protein